MTDPTPTVPPVGPWHRLSARTDPLSLGGIAVEGPGAEIVRDALRRMYDRLAATEAARDDLARHLSPPFTVTDTLGPDLERFNRADSGCENCFGLGRVYLAREDDRAVRLDPSPCPCTADEVPR